MSATHLIIGAGKMGGALIRGWLDAGTVPPRKLAVFDPYPGHDAVYAIEKGAAHISRPEETPDTIDTVLLAVKPQMAAEIAQQISGAIPSGARLISVLAGTSIAELSRLFGERPIIRAMPNTPASIGEGMTAITGEVAEADMVMAETLLAAVGKVIRVDNENQINAVTAISGSGPAYVFLLCEALEAAAKDLGLPKESASDFARQTLIGAAGLLKASPEPADQLRKNVTSPNGTTQAALEVLMDAEGLPPLMIKACRAAYKRAEALAKKA